MLVGLFGMEDKKAVTLLTGGMKEGDRFKFTGTYGSSKYIGRGIIFKQGKSWTRILDYKYFPNLKFDNNMIKLLTARMLHLDLHVSIQVKFRAKYYLNFQKDINKAHFLIKSQH